MGKQSTGDVEYKYYENEEYERIYNGSFKYNAPELDYGYSLSIIGNYKENKKEGIWTYKLSKQSEFFDIKFFQLSITGEYSNGNLNGKWTFKRNTIYKEDYMGMHRIGDNEVNELSICSFKNNKFYSTFQYEFEKVKINGNFDENGFFDGVWKVNWEEEEIPFESIRSYKNGVLYKKIYRNLSTGQIIKKYHSTLLDSIPINKTIKDTIFFINESKYKLEYVDIIEERNYHTPKGLEIIKSALLFWTTNSIIDLSWGSGHLSNHNYLYEIEYGVNKYVKVYEKRITKIK